MKASRDIFRPQAVEFQRQRAFGTPVDMQPLPSAIHLLPLLILVLLLAGLARVRFQPRVPAEVSSRGAKGLVLTFDAGSATPPLAFAPGQLLHIVSEDGDALCVRVTRTADKPCRRAESCVELDGEFDTPASDGTQRCDGRSDQLGRFVTVLPSPRRLIETWN